MVTITFTFSASTVPIFYSSKSQGGPSKNTARLSKIGSTHGAFQAKADEYSTLGLNHATSRGCSMCFQPTNSCARSRPEYPLTSRCLPSSSHHEGRALLGRHSVLKLTNFFSHRKTRQLFVQVAKDGNIPEYH